MTTDFKTMASKPTNDYDPAWLDYWAAHPTEFRAVGADAAPGEGEGDGEGGGDGKGGDNQGGGKDDGGQDGGDGAGKGDGQDKPSTSWRDTITDPAHRKVAERFNSPSDLTAALLETQKELGTRIKPLAKDASAEDVAKYRKAIGVPESPEGYGLTKTAPEGVPEALFKGAAVQERLKGFEAAMHEANVPQAHVNAVIGQYWKMEAQAIEQQSAADEKAAKDAEAALRAKWGEDYDTEFALSQRVMKQNGGTELMNLELRDGRLLGSDARFIEYNAKIGRLGAEGALQTSLEGTKEGGDMNKEIDRLTAEISKAHDLGDSAAVNRLTTERRELIKQFEGITDDAA